MIRRELLALGMAGCMLVLTGCGDDSSPNERSDSTTVSNKSPSKREQPTPPVARKPALKEKVAIPVPEEEDLPPAVMPKVTMSAEDAKACLVKVGDRMPEVSLTTDKGARQSLSALYGEQATVVFFWSSASIYSRQGLADLDRDVVDRYAARGVAVVGINVGQSIEEAQRAIAKAGAKFPQRFDPKGEALAKIATKHLPRTYVLDAKGNILWLDSEYSTFTRRQLRTAIRAVLAE